MERDDDGTRYLLKMEPFELEIKACAAGAGLSGSSRIAGH